MTRPLSAVFFTVLLACSLILVSGCDSLDISPRDELPEEDVWQDPGLVEAYLNDIYGNIGWGYGDPTIAGTADEAVNTHGHGDEPSRLSNFTPDNIGVWEEWTWHESIQKFRWERVYSSVRDLNLFIANVQESEALDAATQETLLGEAHFLRAYFYHNLLRLFGGLPIVDEPFELGQSLEDYHTPRASFEETVEFIVSDLDEAASRLDVTARRPGAASQGAALALKSRVLLHAASDLFADNPSGMPETGYTGGDQQQRWQRAKDAAQAVIDLNEYSLDPAPTADEYHQLLVDGGGNETIWARYFNADGGATHNHSLWVSPNGYNSWSGDTPTQEHVDAYEMADGSEFSWDDLGEDESPYENRDPRLSANVLHNGTVWRERPGGLAELDPVGVYQPGWYETEPGQYDPNGSEPRADTQPGLDTREGPNEQWNGTRSGYNMRKFIDRSILPGSEQAHNPWIFLRYAEVLLNYAEASAELGQPSDAVWALNQVRERVGMPDVPEDGGPGRTLMERIRNERLVELAYEEHRFFDVRRWMIAPDVYSEPARGIRIVGVLDESDPSPIEVWEGITEGYYDYEYEIIDVVDRAWNDKAYFLPILRGEMNANPELVQNPGY